MSPLYVEESSTSLPSDIADESFSRTDEKSWRKARPRPINTSESSTWATDSRDQLTTSTESYKPSEDFCKAIETLFLSAQEQDFEDGARSEFAESLAFLIKQRGNTAVEIIAYLIINRKVSTATTIEALRCFGRIHHPATHNFRLWLLEKSLSSPSFLIRDAAGLGLTSMKDPHAVPFLEQAIRCEPYPELREDLRQVILELKSSGQCNLL